jgi:hypothetical protein
MEQNMKNRFTFIDLFAIVAIGLVFATIACFVVDYAENMESNTWETVTVQKTFSKITYDNTYFYVQTDKGLYECSGEKPEEIYGMAATGQSYKVNVLPGLQYPRIIKMVPNKVE